MKKGMIFIDGSNVFYDWKKAMLGKQLDIQKYIELVKMKYTDVDVLRTYYFTSQTATNGSFLQQINKIPYTQVVTGRLQNKQLKLILVQELNVRSVMKILWTRLLHRWIKEQM